MSLEEIDGQFLIRTASATSLACSESSSSIATVTPTFTNIFPRDDESSAGSVAARAFAWHPSNGAFALVDVNQNALIFRDFDVCSHVLSRVSAETREAALARSRERRAPRACAFRPNRSRVLALACARAVVTHSMEVDVASASSASIGDFGSLSPKDAALARDAFEAKSARARARRRWRTMTYDRSSAREFDGMERQKTREWRECESDAVCWSPDGRAMCASAKASATISYWDVASGSYTALRCGFRGVMDVKFSACGGYLFAAFAGEGFAIWRADGWRSKRFGTGGREISASAFGVTRGSKGDAPVILIAMKESMAISCVHLPARESDGDVDAHVLPLELPEAGERESSSNTDGTSSSTRDIVDMAWDASCSRLAIVLRGGAKNGVVATYATRAGDIVGASLIGYFDLKDASTGARVPARAVRASAPRRSAHGKLTATLAVAFENGDLARVPMSFADPSVASAAS